MRILFLDDMAARQEMFGDIAAKRGHVVNHAWTAEQAIAMLEDGGFDAACLDHDLAEDHYAGPYVSPSMGGTAHSGRAVARWIVEHKRPAEILVHSFNPDGAKAICDILSDWPRARIARAPFGPEACQWWLDMIESRA